MSSLSTEQLQSQLQLLLDDENLVLEEQVQSLWSGYGQIIRCRSNKHQQRYIVKVIAPEGAGEHPRGWNTSASHQRKLTSYQVEACFYQQYAAITKHQNKVPNLIASHVTERFTLLVMEDLDAAGYNIRKDRADWPSLSIAIRWLAYFHACFMHSDAENLWPVGTYWQLATRQDELLAMSDSMPDSPYKHFAQKIDDVLNQAKYKTLVHGDAKFENLCFHSNGCDVAAVDFQYIGGGSGVKDLMYLVGSCLTEEGLIEFDDLILNEYLKHLKQALSDYNVMLDFDELAAETRYLYPIAWADFYRFLLGWNPKSWKICDYMKSQAAIGLSLIK